MAPLINSHEHQLINPPPSPLVICFTELLVLSREHHHKAAGREVTMALLINSHENQLIKAPPPSPLIICFTEL